MSTSASSSKSDFETAHKRIMTKESRAVTRQKLIEYILPDAFIAAISLNVLYTLINNTLRPNP